MSDSAAARYVQEAIESFVKDPPDSAFQRGYLSALLVIWKEAFDRTEPSYDELDKLTTRPISEVQ
jgi:hypothetical protein